MKRGKKLCENVGARESKANKVKKKRKEAQKNGKNSEGKNP